MLATRENPQEKLELSSNSRVGYNAMRNELVMPIENAAIATALQPPVSDPLVRRVQAGDSRAFHDLIKKYQRLVAVIVGRIVRNREDQDELCQEVFIKVYQHIGAYREDASVSTWIGRIAYNTAINHLRRKRTIPFSDLGETYNIENKPAATRSPEQVHEQGVAQDKLERGMAALEPEQRTILALFHVNGMSYNQIGEILQLPAGTVKSQLFRARLALRNRMAIAGGG
jgi:RNA polymerase sigma factor (sigma-70 family)